MTTSRGRRRTGLIVLWVVFALLLAGAGAVATVFVTQRSEIERARTEQAVELQQARDDLDERNGWLVHAETQRDLVRARYAREASQAGRDAACFQYIQGILNEMKTASTIAVQYSRCAP